MFEPEQNNKNSRDTEGRRHVENVTSIINGKISSINQRLDKLTLDFDNNLTIVNGVRSETMILNCQTM